ncbi:MAG: SpoIID/LytB domain-containing protein [Bacteroidota bacterium]
MKRISFSYNDGSYGIYADTSYFGAILPNEFVDIFYVSKDKILLKKGTVELGQFSKIYLVQNQSNTSLVLTPKSPVVKARKYKDDFEIFADKSQLNIVNTVDINNYLSGVVESEGGGGQSKEYYKVQAVMSRTYALKYKSKHAAEGFDLCDRTHCQAYHNMQRFTPLIDSAVLATKNKIIVIGDHQELTDSYFHANCGGQTCEPQYVWNSKVDYLKSFKDTFCIYTKQAKWTKRIPKERWTNFIVKNYDFPVDDSTYGVLLYNFNQTERAAFFAHPIFGIPLRDLRQEFNLKSTFFSSHLEGEEVVLEGRGFGHGVGLCQEGAMKMAKLGYDYQQILEFYFPSVKVVDRNELEYFNQKEQEASF